MRDDEMHSDDEGRDQVQGPGVEDEQDLSISRVEESAQEPSSKTKVSSCECGYHPRAADTHWIAEYEVIHVICYKCGKEWVE